jgi:hypothetical protein
MNGPHGSKSYLAIYIKSIYKVIEINAYKRIGITVWKVKNVLVVLIIF